MIIEFGVENFRSIKKSVTLSLEAEPLKNKKVQVLATDQIKVLPTAAIFGPNSSGKSNIYKALLFMQWAVVNSNASAVSSPAPKHPLLSPFLLNTKTRNKPSRFYIVLWDKDEQIEFKYGFEMTKEKVTGEWLEVTNTVNKYRRSFMVFERTNQKFEFHKSASKDLSQLQDKVLDTVLAVSVFAQFAHKLSFRLTTLMSAEHLFLAPGANVLAQSNIDSTIRDPKKRQQILRWVQQIDNPILEIMVKNSPIKLEDIANAPVELRPLLLKSTNTRISTSHRVHDTKDEVAVFDLLDNESEGTRNFIGLIALILPILSTGGTMVVDELGASLHPFIAKVIIDIFSQRRTNPKGAQLIFTTHETYLLSGNVDMRRDQIWFTEKDRNEETYLRSLSEYKTRSDLEIAKNYLEGRFGAVPVVDELGE